MSLTNIVKINGTELPSVKKFVVGRNKLWSNADRNMKGDLRATFVGIFPKLKISFAPMSDDDLSTIDTLLDLSFFTVVWWDTRSQSFKSGQYYASDYDNSLLNKTKELWDGFDVDLVPVSKLS